MQFIHDIDSISLDSTLYPNFAHTEKKITMQKSTLRDKNEVRNSIIAGSMAGMISCLIFHPLDVIRTKLQATASLEISNTSSIVKDTKVKTSSVHNLSHTTSTINSVRVTSFDGPMSVFRHTVKNGGYKAFYTGLSLPLAAQAVYKATIYTTNRLSQNVLLSFKSSEENKYVYTSSPSQQLSLLDHFICGAASGAINALIFVAPVEYVRSQLIEQHSQIYKSNHNNSLTNVHNQNQSAVSKRWRGPIDVMKFTIRENGFLGLWRGAGITLMRDSLGCGAFFAMFEFGQRNAPSITGRERGTLINSICSGFLAGFGYWFASLPLDSLKTLVQTGKASSSLSALRNLIERNGIVGTGHQLYRGWEVGFGRGCPSAAITLTFYSFAYRFLETNFD